MVHLEKKLAASDSRAKKILFFLILSQAFAAARQKKFDIIYEGYADPFDLNSEQPDVVVYDKKGSKPALLVEFLQ